jgi:hypothetical protein
LSLSENFSQQRFSQSFVTGRLDIRSREAREERDSPWSEEDKQARDREKKEAFIYV